MWCALASSWAGWHCLARNKIESNSELWGMAEIIWDLSAKQMYGNQGCAWSQ